MTKLKADILSIQEVIDDLACDIFYTITLRVKKRPNLDYGKEVEIIQDGDNAKKP